jgi:SAM-dependent methyltransferase
MPNEAMAGYWDVMGRAWVANQRTFDRMLGPIQDVLLDRVAVGGATVLDVGCGYGTTSLALTELGASVHGVDVSEPMIAVARGRVPGAMFAVTDAQVDDLGGPYDWIVSRFGVMFFDDPSAAFTNLRRHAAADGRLAFVCWNDVERSSAVWAGADVIRAALPEPPPPLDPHAPGPFGLSDRARTERILAEAGWRDVAIEGHVLSTPIGWPGEDGVEARVALLAESEVGRMLRQQVEPARVDRVLDEVRAALRDRVVDGAIQLEASIWLVTASA